MKKLSTLSLFAAALIGIGLWVAFPSDSCAAAAIAAQTCDTQVWQTMEARARIETEREIMQNQNLIFKSDSILNYMCFDSFAAHTASTVGPLFTHTTYWNGQLILPWGGRTGLDSAINNTIGQSMRTYLTANFNHAYLGGRGNEYATDTGGHRAPSLAPPSSPATASQSSTYSCAEMAKVWAAAKCANFLHTARLGRTDGFYPFIDLKAETGGENIAGYESIQDVRMYPSPVDCRGINPIEGSSWLDMYRTSRNEVGFGNPNQIYQFGVPVQRTYSNVRNLISPVTDTDSGDCGDPVATGVQVILGVGSASTYPDGVCTNPGCTFIGNDCVKARRSTPVGPR